MDVRHLLEAVQAGTLSIAQAEAQLLKLPFETLDFAKLDHHRMLRRGFGEVIYAPGKSESQLLQCLERLHQVGSNVLATRVTPKQAEVVSRVFPEVHYSEVSRLLSWSIQPVQAMGRVAVCSGGTGDLSVAEEAAETAAFFGCCVDRFFDVGVAGLHRLLNHLEELRQAHAIAVVAGMEGALGSVVAGLVEVPVIAVPTSVGYGASFGGVAALLTMLNSCAEGLSVVNIDNGFGAGYLLAQINRLIEGKHGK